MGSLLAHYQIRVSEVLCFSKVHSSVFLKSILSKGIEDNFEVGAGEDLAFDAETNDGGGSESCDLDAIGDLNQKFSLK